MRRLFEVFLFGLTCWGLGTLTPQLLVRWEQSVGTGAMIILVLVVALGASIWLELSEKDLILAAIRRLERERGQA